MTRNQLENLYIINGIKAFKLKSTDDLLKTHGIDYTAIKGYDTLNGTNRELYEKFIVRIFNAWGMDSRATLEPLAIHYVEDTTLLVKENSDDGYYIVAGGIVKALIKDGSTFVLHRWNDKEYKHLEVVKKESKTYLRFEYRHQGRKEWLHVINKSDGVEWY